ncbi:DUF3995 domain-containing protein [Actinomyces viscosus]|uniref:Uncharacterized protein n=1 Tax=Actinomyces viscosus TaxID=1656 RepID=A0A3S4Z3N8_ACTVI|nr:DUF3995 domain-containing protein [Actinomyces viscosus]TFH52843.1 DUF3995 domain-containing protein [Actinomyces viscosus]VEI18507.1 Uncharacterised protein [Actinomyces viscosus]
MTGRSRAIVIAMMLWWAFFGCVSVSWALGSPWLVDTALQGGGLRLAQERPTWFVVVVLVSGLVKLGFVVYGFALLRLDVIRVPRWMRLAFGWVSGVLLMAYGLVGSAGLVLRLLAGQSLSRYGWWRLLLWMPHFWVGGILVLSATVAYLRWSRPGAVEVQEI